MVANHGGLSRLTENTDKVRETAAQVPKPKTERGIKEQRVIYNPRGMMVPNRRENVLRGTHSVGVI
jgi:hypothetical protein